MAYQTKDGITLEGRTPVEVISNLRDRAWLMSPDLEGYVAKTAYFAELTTGVPVRGDTAENLLTDLMSVGLILKVN